MVDCKEYIPLKHNEVPIEEEPLVGTVEPSNEWIKKGDNFA